MSTVTRTGIPISSTPEERLAELEGIGWERHDDGYWRINEEKYRAYLASLPEPPLQPCPGTWCIDHSWEPPQETHAHRGPVIEIPGDLGGTVPVVEMLWFEVDEDRDRPFFISDQWLTAAQLRDFGRRCIEMADEVERGQ